MGATLHPTIVFEVNLETIERLSHLQPDAYQSSPDHGNSEADNRKYNRSTWLPGLTAGENAKLKHGDQFTVSGMRADYLRRTYTTGENPILTVISVS